MSNTPDVPTDWGMWDSIESSLEKKKKRWFLPIFAGLPILLLLSGVLGYVLAPKSNSTQSNNLEIIRDTVYLTESIHTVDTIVKTEYITQWKYHNAEQNLALRSQVRNLEILNESLLERINGLDTKLNDYRYAFSESILKNNPKYKNLDFFKPESAFSSVSENNSIIPDRSEIDIFAFSPILDFRALTYERPRIMLIHNLLFENLVQNKKSKSVLDQIIPDYINVGASIETPGISLMKNLSPVIEFGIGMNAELMFSPKFSFVTGIRFRSSQNKTTDSLIASTFPQPSVSVEEEFKSLKVKSSFIDIPLTFKYDVFEFKDNNVYLTVGLFFSNHNQTEYKYEYFRNSSEVYYEEKGVSLGWGLGSSLLGIGYEVDPWDSVSAFVESYARYNFKNDGIGVHGVGFRFGMYYKI